MARAPAVPGPVVPAAPAVPSPSGPPAAAPPALDAVEAHVVADDAEALATAERLAAAFRPGAAARDAARARPWDEVRELRASGLLGITVPRRHGGAGVSVATLVEVFSTLSAADPSLGQIPQNHFCFVATIFQNGTEDQQRAFAAELLGGALFGNALSERNGRPPGTVSCVLEPDGDGFRLSARKYYCTGALFAQWLPVMVLDHAVADRHHLAYVPRRAPGVEVVDDWSAMGQVGTASGTVVLTDVAVPRQHVVPRSGPRPRPGAGAFGQVLHAAIDVGIAQEALADGVAHLRDRSRPVLDAVLDLGIEAAGDEPHSLRRVGELQVQVDAAAALLARSADLVDRAADAPDDDEAAVTASFAVAGAKAYAGDLAVQVASAVFDLSGASAADERWNLHRHWRNARTHTLHDPSRWKYHHIGNWEVNRRLPPPSVLI